MRERAQQNKPFPRGARRRPNLAPAGRNAGATRQRRGVVCQPQRGVSRQQRAVTSTYNFNNAIHPNASSLQLMFVGGSVAHIMYVPMQQKRRKTDNKSELWVYNSAQSLVASAKKRDLRATSGRTPKHCWGMDSAWSIYAYAIIFGGLRPNGTMNFLCRLKFNRLWFRVAVKWKLQPKGL